jgi:hypothetical protein
VPLHLGPGRKRSPTPTGRDSALARRRGIARPCGGLEFFATNASVKRTGDIIAGGRTTRSKPNIWTALPTRLNVTVHADNCIIGKSPRRNCSCNFH